MERLLIVKTFGFLFCALCSGCFCSSYRNYTTVSVVDVGDNISTKYKYRIAAIDGRLGIHNAHDMPQEHEIFKSQFRNVFSEDGIPVMVRVSTSGGSNKYGWTQGLAGFSLTLFPALYHNDVERAVELVMVNDDTVRGTFTITDASERTEGVLPTALIPFGGAPQHGRNRVYWRSDSSIGTEGMVQKARSDFFNGCPDFAHQGFVYGIAAKLKEMEDMGVVDAMLRRLTAAGPKVPEHRIVRLERESGSDFVYVFAIELAELSDDMGSTLTAVAREFGEQIKEEFVETYPGTQRSLLVVDFANMKGEGKMVVGRAIVLTIKPISLSYDANTRRGRLSVKFSPGQYEEARAWARKNIETLARDKNLVLVTGQLPPEARYYSLGETVKDGNVLEIEFRTE